MRVIVIGGDAAGMSAASQVKRQRPEYEVIVFERGEYISYAACGVPYYVGGAVAGLDDLVEVSPEEAREKRRVDLRLRHTVVAIDPSKRTVTVEHDGAQAVEPYDRLLIATGARAQSMGIDVGAYPNVFTMNDLYDAARIREFLVDRKPRSVRAPSESISMSTCSRRRLSCSRPASRSARRSSPRWTVRPISRRSRVSAG